MIVTCFRSELSPSVLSSPTAPVSTTKDVQGDDSEEDDKGIGTDDSSQINCTVPGYPGVSDDTSVGVIKEWITAFNFLRGGLMPLPPSFLYLKIFRFLFLGNAIIFLKKILQHCSCPLQSRKKKFIHSRTSLTLQKIQKLYSFTIY